MQRGLGEFLDPGNLRIGIGLDEIGHVVGRKAEIDADIAVEFQRAADALGETLDARRRAPASVLRRDLA